jgi:hypothetical protein
MTESRVPLLIRIPASLKAKLAEVAERERRSLNRQIEFLLDRSIRDEAESERRETPVRKGRGRRRP